MFKVLLLSIFSLFLSDEYESIDLMHEEIYETLDSDLDLAKTKAKVALELSKSEGYKFGEANSLYIMAFCDDLNNQLNTAVPEYLKSLEIFSHISGKNSAINQSEIYLNLGRIFNLHYKYDDAINFYEKSYDIAMEYDLLYIATDALNNMSIAYREKGDLVKAKELLFEKLALVKDEDVTEKIFSYNEIGIIHSKLRDFEESRTYFNHILKLTKSKKLSIHRAKALHNIAFCYLEENNFRQAEDYYLQVLNEKKNIGEHEMLFTTYLDLTELYLKTESAPLAEETGQNALAASSNVRMDSENNKINLLLSQVYFELNEPMKVKKYYDSYIVNMEKLHEEYKELTAMGDHYKTELIKSNHSLKIQYYSLGLGIMALIFFVFLAYNRNRKAIATKLLREHFSSISFKISDTGRLS